MEHGATLPQPPQSRLCLVLTPRRLHCVYSCDADAAAADAPDAPDAAAADAAVTCVNCSHEIHPESWMLDGECIM